MGGNVTDVLPDIVFADVIVPTLCPNATLVGPGRYPSLAWNGNAYAVTYLNPNQVELAVIDATGTPASPTVIRGTSFIPQPPVITWRAPSWIVGMSGDGAFLQEVTAAGTPTGPLTSIDGLTNSASVSFATGGGPLRIAWLGFAMQNFEVFTAGVGAGLAITNPLQVTSSAFSPANPHVAWNGTDWLAIWDSSKTRMSCVEHSLETHRVTAGGLANGQDVRAHLFNCDNRGNAENHGPQLFWNGTDYNVVWDPIVYFGTPRAPQDPIQTARFAGTLVTPTNPTTSGFSFDASALLNGSELATAWAGGGIFITRSDLGGVPLSEITIDSGGEYPSLVFDGTRYAVAYERDGNIYFARTCP